MEFNFLLADCEIPALQLLGHGVKPVAEIEVDERALFILQLIESRCFLEYTAQVGELVVSPDLLEPEFFGFLLVPCVIEMQRTRIVSLRSRGFAMAQCQIGSEYAWLTT